MFFNPLANTATSLCYQLLLLLSLTYSSQVLAQFTEAPADLNVTEGNPLSLNCTFTSADRMFWQKDGREITSGNASFSTASATADMSTLILLPSAEHTAHTGIYNCVAVRGGIEFSTNFTITVQYLADVSISFRPFECTEGDENPYIGSMVIIDCSAEGEPFPRVTWFFHGNILRDFNVPNIHFQQNNRVLVIPSLQSNNSGHYYCQSENDLFSAKRSSDIGLGFQVPESSSTSIMITNADTSDIIYAALGGLATIKCSIFPPIPHQNVVFRRQGSNIMTGQEYSVVSSPCNMFSLSISSVKNSHAGPYTCALDLSGITLMDNINIQIKNIDECQNDTLNNCDHNADCFDTEDSFYCICRAGYIGTGIQCQDIDERASSDANDCHPAARCNNTVGSFDCTCLCGFEGNATLCNAAAGTHQLDSLGSNNLYFIGVTVAGVIAILFC